MFTRKPIKEEWTTYDEHVEFLSSSSSSSYSSDLPPVGSTAHTLARQLAQQSQQQQQQQGSSSSSLYQTYTANTLAEGQSEYDEYQQAWRYLGVFIDCDDVSRWDDDDANGGGSRDNNNGATPSGQGCKRFVLWAAYVDLNYQGGGIGEYQYWDRVEQEWDETPCNYGDGGGSNDNANRRCAKMDCHLEDTQWSLLGLFKHRSPDDWMEQLFKHEGMCIWTQDEYSFMKGARKAWPTGCYQSPSKTLTGSSIYYDIKPVAGGSMTLGLYTDVRCVEEYHGPTSVEQVVGNVLAQAESSGSQDNNADYSSLTMSQAQATWDSAFSIFQTCQPCVAHDLTNVGYNADDDASRGSAYGTYTYQGNGQGGGDDDNDGYNYNYEWNDFDCFDDADYLNVNQCMKFMAKTSMDTATMRDVLLAHRQGTLVEQQPVPGLQGRSNPRTSRSHVGADIFGSTVYALVSVVTLCYGALVLVKAMRKTKYKPSIDLKEYTMPTIDVTKYKPSFDMKRPLASFGTDNAAEA